MKRAKELRAAAWEKKKGRWGMLALVFFIYSLIMAACAALSYVVVGAVAVLLLSGPLMLGFTMVCLAVSRRQGASLSKLFEGFSRFGDSLVLFLLMDIFIFLWSLLLVIPGIIKMYSYSMSWFVLHDRPDLTGNEARKRSMYLMKGHKWRLFCLDFSFIGWYLLSALTLGILSFWVTPYHMTARAEFYQELLEEEKKTQQQIANSQAAVS